LEHARVAADVSDAAPAERSFVAEAGRLDRVAADALALRRAEVQRAIADGRLLVDGRARAKSFRLEGGERVELSSVSSELEAEGPPVDVPYEDEFLLVVSKPAGVVTHPAPWRLSGTLVNRLLGEPLAPAGGPLRPGIVRRLDVGTSGLVVVAGDDETYEALRS